MTFSFGRPPTESDKWIQTEYINSVSMDSTQFARKISTSAIRKRLQISIRSKIDLSIALAITNIRVRWHFSWRKCFVSVGFWSEWWVDFWTSSLDVTKSQNEKETILGTEDDSSPDMHVLSIHLYLSLIPNKHSELRSTRISRDFK